MYCSQLARHKNYYVETYNNAIVKIFWEEGKYAWFYKGPGVVSDHPRLFRILEFRKILKKEDYPELYL